MSRGVLRGLARPLAQPTSSGHKVQAKTKADGYYELRLGAGRWWLAVWPEPALGMQVRTLRITTRADSLKAKDVVIERVGTLEIRLPGDDSRWVLSGIRKNAGKTASPFLPGTPDSIATSSSLVLTSERQQVPIAAGDWTLYLSRDAVGVYAEEVHIREGEIHLVDVAE